MHLGVLNTVSLILRSKFLVLEMQVGPMSFPTDEKPRDMMAPDFDEVEKAKPEDVADTEGLLEDTKLTRRLLLKLDFRFVIATFRLSCPSVLERRFR